MTIGLTVKLNVLAASDTMRSVHFSLIGTPIFLASSCLPTCIRHCPLFYIFCLDICMPVEILKVAAIINQSFTYAYKPLVIDIALYIRPMSILILTPASPVGFFPSSSFLCTTVRLFFFSRSKSFVAPTTKCSLSGHIR